MSRRYRTTYHHRAGTALGLAGYRTTCGLDTLGRTHALLTTTDPEAVTCWRCDRAIEARRTAARREAAAALECR